MKITSTTSLALLTAATADYETAWRESLLHPAASDEYRASVEQMHRAYKAQEVALRELETILGSTETARAIHGALIQAAALTTGERPYEPGGTADAVLTFIMQVVAQEAGV